MGVLRYFPGVEPPERPSDGEREDARPAGRGIGRAEAGWAVPGVTSGGVREEDPESARPAPDRLLRAAPDPDHADGVPGPPTPAELERVSLAALGRHDVSEAEMLRRLLDKGFDEAVAETEVARLTRVGLLDDEALARRLVTALRERKGLGAAALAPALRQRRIPPSIIDAVLVEQDDEAELDRLEAVARGRARRLGGLDAAAAERRLTAYLLRRGYSGPAVRDAVRRALAVSE